MRGATAGGPAGQRLGGRITLQLWNVREKRPELVQQRLDRQRLRAVSVQVVPGAAHAMVGEFSKADITIELVRDAVEVALPLDP